MARYIDAEKIDYSMVSIYWETDKDGKDIYRRCAVAFETNIDEMPTADVEEVRHGEWIFKQRYYEADKCNCSLCGQLMTTAKGTRVNYCPNCGAKMKG